MVDVASEELASGETAKPTVVGIGASAGGISALKAFFAALSETSRAGDTAAAFVVIVHLDPQVRSELPAILATSTRMPVSQVVGTEHLQPDHVYVIPPDRRLRLTDHEISTAAFDEPRGRRAPIDLFFRSLAEQHGQGFAVILSGAGSDGAVGVRDIKEAGGIILVQDPAEAEYPSMPRSAIATGVADLVLPVRDLAVQLVPLIRSGQAVLGEGEVDEELLRRLLAHVRVRTGHDFSKYKRSTVLRRIMRRIQVTRSNHMAGYYDLLRDDADEAQALLADLLISVTTFFRDAEAFDALKRLAVPPIIDSKDLSETVRVWVPGCATGEEAYSVAMILLEEGARRESRPAIQVFGSDLDARALALAREGCYPAAIEADVSEERLRRFFQREGDHYRARRELRDVVVFASHSLLKDPPFSRIDLVSCRNLLIYLDRELQQQVCSTFHYALKPGGFLLLGSSETVDSPPGLFRVIDRKYRIYQSTASPDDKPRTLPQLLSGTIVHDHRLAPARSLTPAALNEASQHRQALEKVAPPSALVDEAHRVVHLSEHAGRFLQPAGGPLTGDIVDLVRPELRFELRSALHRVFDLGEPTLTLPILVQFNGAPHRVHLLVKLATGDAEAGRRRAVVLFIEGEAVTPGGSTAAQRAATDDTVRRLTEELALTQARLRTTRDESEAATEELRAANEELQSINEEYRSTSEELETSREELQSINEELETVNSELKLKLDAVSRANSDLQNLMAATDFGTLFLDASLRIKRFTRQVTDVFHFAPSDEGRPVTDFAHQLEYHDLVKDAEAVIANLAPIRREVKSRDGRWYDLRLRPYRTVDDRIDGVVITFVDVTERLQVEQALRDSEQSLRQDKRLVEISHDPIFVWDLDDGIVEWNRGSEELYGYSRAEALGKRKEVLLGTIVPNSSFAALREHLLAKGAWSGELRHHTKDGRELTVESRIVLDPVGDRRLALETTRDVTERRTFDGRQRLLLRELTHRVKNTLAVVQAIAHQTQRHSRSPQDFIVRFDGRLQALSRAHGLLVGSNWTGADMEAIARSQLEAYTSDNPDRLRIEGKRVTLSADLATPLGLVLHELATNAAKHGALSRPGGTVALRWSMATRDDKPMLTVVWSEAGGPPVATPTTSGFGGILIESGIPHATVRREFRAEGFVCTMEIALHDAAENGAG